MSSDHLVPVCSSNWGTSLRLSRFWRVCAVIFLKEEHGKVEDFLGLVESFDFK